MAGNKTDITTVFKADISQFSESVNSLKRYISTVNSEFKVATKGASDWSKSQDGLKAKITQLNRTLQAQEQIVAELEKEYENISKEQGENSAAAQKLTIEINKYRAAISKTKNDINKFNKNLDDLADTSKESEDSLEDLSDATKDLDDGFTVAKGAIAGFIANGLTALVGAAKNAVTKIYDLAESTREYRQTLATLDTAANDVGASTDKIRDKFTHLMGVFNDEDSVTEGLNNLLTAGFDEKGLDDITESLEGAALKWKDTLKFEGLADSLQEWIGTGGENLSGQFAELLERMGYNLDDVKAKTAGMTDEQRRTYATNLLAAEGLNTVSESYREQNKDIVEAQTANVEYQNSLATLGAKAEPVITKIREGFTKLLDKVIELVDGVDIEALGTTIENAFNSFINDILPKIIEGLQWIIDNKDILISGIAGIGAAFVAWKVVGIVQGIVGAIKTWMAVTKGMTIAQKALNLVMKMNPIGLVVSAIAALVAAFIYLWKNCDEFRAFWINLWDNIKKIADKTWKAIKGFFVNAWNSIKSTWKSAKNFFSDIWKGITSTFKNVGSWFSDKFKQAYNGIRNAFSGIKKFFGGIWDSVVSTFKSVGTKVANAIGGAFKSAINAVIGTVEKGINVIPNTINKALGTINKLPGVEIGRMSTINLPRLAKGSVLDKPTTAIVAEAGKEAIIPLERHTKGIDLIAGKLAERMDLDRNPINVTYNQTFANAPTTRYGLRKAMADNQAMWQLLQILMGGV